MSSFFTSLSSQILLISTFIFLLSTLSFASTPQTNSNQRPFKKIYAFGDSSTDTGNTNSSTGPNIFRGVSSLPYGRTFFHRPTNRYSDGRLVIDFVAESLSLPFLPPYLNKSANTSHGVNFAVAGCTAIPYRFFVRNNLTNNIVPQSLETQLTWFNKYLEGTGCHDAKSTPIQCENVFDDALVWVGAISGNDYNYAFGTSVTSKTVQRLAIRSQTKFLQALLKKGAKYVVVQGLPATGCLTVSMVIGAQTDRDDIGCVATKNKESYDHNMILQSKLQKLKKQYPKAIIVYGDDWNAYREVFKNPIKYGFQEPFKACCGTGGEPYNFAVSGTCGTPSSTTCKDPSKYVDWDGLHNTEAMNKVAASFFLKGKFTYPTFQYLLSKKGTSV